MHLLISFSVGGAEVVAFNLSRSVDSSAFRCMASSLSGDGPMRASFEAEGISTRCLQRRNAFFGLDWALVWRLARLLKREHVSILHCHNRAPLIYGALAARAAGLKVVVCTRHALNARPVKGKVWFWERLLSPMTTHVIAVSHTVRDIGLRTGRMSEERSSVIYNGVDMELFTPGPGRKEGRDGTVAIGCVARLSDEKRHVDLIGAVCELRRRGRDVEAYLVGDGPMRKQLEDEVGKLGLRERIHFLGRRADVPKLLRGFDVFVLPSRFEGLPMTVIEAMAAGLPVVATKVGSLHEIVEDGGTGLLVRPKEPPELAAAVEKLVADERLRKVMGAAGRKVAVERFSLSAAARQHEELYRRLLRDKGIRMERRS